MIKATVRGITLAEAFPMRRYLLRPMLPALASHYTGDDHVGAIHLGAFADLGGGEELVGTVSFLPRNQEGEFDDHVYQLQGMVTLPAVRNQNIGAALAQHGISLVQERGAEVIWCNARTSAASFYVRLGFQAVGAEFITPGTGPHFRYVMDLS